MDLHILVAEQPADQVVADVQPGDFHQPATHRAIIDQHLQLAIGAAEQSGHRVATAADARIAVELTEAGLHRREGGKQLLELEVTRAQTHLPLQRRGRTIETDLRVEHTAGHAETQWLQTQHAVIEHHMGVEIGDR